MVESCQLNLVLQIKTIITNRLDGLKAEEKFCVFHTVCT